MTSSKRLLGCAIGAAFAFATVSSSAASANSDVKPPTGITVPAGATAAPAVLFASLEGRNEVTAGAPQGQALELIGIHDNTLSYAISWRGIGTPSEAAIHAGVRGADGPVVVPLFTTPRPPGGFVSGTVTVSDPILLAALRAGGDQWDNPRYRTILFLWQSMIAGYVWVWWCETHNVWFVRVVACEVAFLLIFTQWYASRYFHWGGQAPFAVMIALILGLWGVILGIGWWQDKKRA